MNDDGDRVLNVLFFFSSFILHASPHFRSTIKPLSMRLEFFLSLLILSMTTGNDGYMLPIQRRILLVADRFFLLSKEIKDRSDTDITGG